MFFPPGLTNEQIKLLFPKKETFEEYYNRQLTEEYRAFSKNPRFSIKTMLVMAKLPEYIIAKCEKEYYGVNH